MNRIVKWIVALSVALSSAPLAAQTVEYIHTDALGSVVAVSDAAGNIIERREYEPYGAQLTPVLRDGPGYTGHVQDAATGLTYMQQRYYDPQVGLFLSVDPVTAYSNPVGMFNRYRYANNNPYRFTDSDGRQAAERFVEQHRRDMEAGNGKLYEPFEKPAIAATAIMLLGPASPYAIRAWLTSPATANSVANTVLEVGAGDALGGASLVVGAGAATKAVEAAGDFGPFHRLGDSPSAIDSIESSGQLLGNPPTNFFQSPFPKVKAYDGPLPSGAQGFEFRTPVAPDAGHVPGKPTWTPGTPGVGETGGKATIPCAVTNKSC